MFMPPPWCTEPYPAPPERLPPTPRTVAFNTRARVLRATARACLLLVPNALLYCGWVSGADLRELDAHGRTVTGVVTGRSCQTGGRGRRTHQVVYAYRSAGREYSVRAPVSSREYAALTPDAACLVTYSPDRPWTNCPGRPGDKLRRHNEGAVLSATVVAAMLGVWVVGLELTLRRECCLAREGEPAIGWLTEQGVTRDKNGTHYCVRHEFTSPADEPVTSWHYVPRVFWERLRPGTRVTVLYDPARARRHLPLYAFRSAYVVEEVNEDRSPS